MSWHSMADLGDAVIGRGYTLKADKADEACSEVNVTMQLACVQVAMLRELRYIRREIASGNGDLYAIRTTARELRRHFIPAKKVPPKKNGKVLISSLDLSKLRVRARNVVRRILAANAARYTSDLNQLFLLRQHQCGAATAMEIHKWAGIKKGQA